MRVHVLADLHLEFGSVEIPSTDADIVVLAGDIDVGRKGLEWIKSHFRDRPVIYVLGNHESYRNSFPDLTQSLRDEARERC
jgi:hypothetical protein